MNKLERAAYSALFAVGMSAVASPVFAEKPYENNKAANKSPLSLEAPNYAYLMDEGRVTRTTCSALFNAVGLGFTNMGGAKQDQEIISWNNYMHDKAMNCVRNISQPPEN